RAGDARRADELWSQQGPPAPHDVDVLAARPLDHRRPHVHGGDDVDTPLPHLQPEGVRLETGGNQPTGLVDVAGKPFFLDAPLLPRLSGSSSSLHGWHRAPHGPKQPAAPYGVRHRKRRQAAGTFGRPTWAGSWSTPNRTSTPRCPPRSSDALARSSTSSRS